MSVYEEGAARRVCWRPCYAAAAVLCAGTLTDGDHTVLPGGVSFVIL